MKHPITKRLTTLLSVLLVVSICCTILAGCTQSTAANKLAVATPTYPEAVKAPGDDASDADYEAWQAYNDKRLEAAKGNTKAMQSFYQKTLKQILGKQNGKNAVYSPLNVYLALAMLAETTDGDSRQQLLTLLGEKDLKSLRSRVKKLFTANYQDDGVCTSLLANSLWMNEALTYNQEALDTLAKKHYAWAFAGEPGTDAMNKALQGWINEQTHDLLKDQASTLTLDPATVLALVSTIYYKAAWSSPFEASATKKQTFHAPSGDKQVDMMHLSESLGYYTGKNFTAVALPLDNSGYMWFFLPKEGVDPSALASDKQVLSALLETNSYQDFSYPLVKLALPKMDAVSDKDLIKDLKKLGVTDVFDPVKGDFKPLMKDADGIFVSQVKHAARVKTDEEGVEAAAFTAIVMTKSSMPEKTVTFTVDRPYYFALTGYTGDLLFAGVVNDPVAQ